MADYTPVFTGDSLPFTSTTSAAVTGGQVLIVTGSGTVGPAAAASGSRRRCRRSRRRERRAGHRAAPCRAWSTRPSRRPAAAGNALSSAAAGNRRPRTLGTLAAAGTLIGVALTTATAGNKCQWTYPRLTPDKETETCPGPTRSAGHPVRPAAHDQPLPVVAHADRPTRARLRTCGSSRTRCSPRSSTRAAVPSSTRRPSRSCRTVPSPPSPRVASTPARRCRTAPPVAAVLKWGQRTDLTDEEITRNARPGSAADRKLRKLVNSVIKRVDAIAMSAVHTAITANTAATTAWATIATATPFNDIQKAKAQIRKLNLGCNPDIVVAGRRPVRGPDEQRDRRRPLRRENRGRTRSARASSRRSRASGSS